MIPNKLTGLAALAARVLLGGWFVYSGAVKILGGAIERFTRDIGIDKIVGPPPGAGLDRFTRDVGNYQLVGPPLDAIAAYTVPWFEVVAGLCLLIGILRRGAILTVAGMVCVFAFCIGWAWVRQLDISCGCHGGDAPIQYWNKAAEFAGYFIVLAWLWCTEHQPAVGGAAEKMQNAA